MDKLHTIHLQLSEGRSLSIQGVLTKNIGIVLRNLSDGEIVQADKDYVWIPVGKIICATIVEMNISPDPIEPGEPCEVVAQ